MSRSWAPSFFKDSYKGTGEVAIQSYLLTNRNIFLQGEITEETANQFLLQMLYLQSQNQDPIQIFINSCGGSVNAGMAIYDLIQSVNKEVNLYCVGMAASMAAIILAGGQQGHRFILPHSQTMIHEPMISRGVGGSASSIKNISDSMLETRELLTGILSQHTNHSIEEIAEQIAYDHYMNAEETVAFGICDRILTTPFEKIYGGKDYENDQGK